MTSPNEWKFSSGTKNSKQTKNKKLFNCIIAHNQKYWKPLSLYIEYQSPYQEVNEEQDRR